MSIFINVLKATLTKFSAVGSLNSTNVQSAIAELDGRVSNLDAANVKTTGIQSVGGAKTFTNDVVINSNKVTFGKTGDKFIVNQILLNTGLNEAPFAITTGGGDFPGGFDPVMFWGFNIGSAGKIVPTVPSIGLAIESRFINNGIEAFEYNFDYASADGNVNKRFLYFLTDRSDGSKALWWYTIGTDALSRFLIQDDSNNMLLSVEGSKKRVRLTDELQFEVSTPSMNPSFINANNQKPFYFAQGARGTDGDFAGVVASSLVLSTSHQDSQLPNDFGSLTLSNKINFNAYSFIQDVIPNNTNSNITIARNDTAKTTLSIGSGSVNNADNQLRVVRAPSEFIQLSANANGNSGSTNSYCLDMVGASGRDFYIRRVNTSFVNQVQYMRFTYDGFTQVNTPLQVTDTTASTSTTTGSTFAGGIGVAGAGYFGGNLYFAGTLFGTSAVKSTLISSDNGTTTLTELFSSNHGTLALGQGSSEQMFQLRRNGTGEYFNMLAARNGPSGLNNAYYFDFVSPNVGSIRPAFFRARETGTNTVNNLLSLFPANRVAIAGNTDDGINTLQVNGSGKFSSSLTTAGRQVTIRSVSATTTTTVTDEILLVNSNGGSVPISLLAPATAGTQKLTITKTDGNGLTNVTVTGTGLSVTLTTTNPTADIVSTGSAWVRLR